MGALVPPRCEEVQAGELAAVGGRGVGGCDDLQPPRGAGPLAARSDGKPEALLPGLEGDAAPRVQLDPLLLLPNAVDCGAPAEDKRRRVSARLVVRRRDGVLGHDSRALAEAVLDPSLAIGASATKVESLRRTVPIKRPDNRLLRRIVPRGAHKPAADAAGLVGEGLAVVGGHESCAGPSELLWGRGSILPAGAPHLATRPPPLLRASLPAGERAAWGRRTASELLRLSEVAPVERLQLLGAHAPPKALREHRSEGQDHRLRRFRPPGHEGGEVGRVPARDVGHRVLREGDRIAELLPPPRLVEEGLVVRRLAGVEVHPPPLCRGEVLGPHVVRPVEHDAGVEPHGPAAEGEAVGPLAASPPAGVQELSWVVVARESRTPAAGLTPVQLDPRGTVPQVLA
mmetsp:Transcript_4245/g.10276  ORF Transcript_4245/g.10276 Transcript_4245/m.10276 type:complete len:400 (+) Transcript_4245:323-1522(+)